MTYGVPIDVPIILEEPVEVSVHRPELEELPRMAATSTQAIRLRDTLLKRLPSVANLDAVELSLNSSRAVEFAQLMMNIAEAHRVTRSQNHLSDLIARRDNREIDRWLRLQEADRIRQARILQARTVQAEKRAVRRFAREILGIGPDIWK